MTIGIYLEPLVVEPVCLSCNHRRGLAVDTFTKHPEYWADLKQRDPNGKQGTASPVTYRISSEVNEELKRLAALHGGVDKALRVLFEWASPLANTAVEPVAVESIAARPNNRIFRTPLLKPSERGKK